MNLTERCKKCQFSKFEHEHKLHHMNNQVSDTGSDEPLVSILSIAGFFLDYKYDLKIYLSRD